MAAGAVSGEVDEGDGVQLPVAAAAAAVGEPLRGPAVSGATSWAAAHGQGCPSNVLGWLTLSWGFAKGSPSPPFIRSLRNDNKIPRQ